MFLDRQSIERGDNLSTTIESEIENTFFLLAIGSPSVYDSIWIEIDLICSNSPIPVLIFSRSKNKQIKGAQNLHRLSLDNTKLLDVSNKQAENKQVNDVDYIRSKIILTIESRHAEGLKKTHESAISWIYKNLEFKGLEGQQRR